MRRIALPFLVSVAITACTDASLPLAVPNDGPAYDHTPLILTVTNTEDSGSGSLRAAIAQSVSGDRIVFDGALAGQTITLTSGTLVLDKNLAITAPSAGGITVTRASTAPDFSIFEVASDVTATIENLTISNGRALAFPYNSGGGIHNQGNLTLLNSTLVGNFGNRGGAIANARLYPNPTPILTMINSTISGNTANNGGAGVYNVSGFLTVKHSTITANASNGVGDGIYSIVSSTLRIENSIIAGNLGDVYSFATSITASYTLIGQADENTRVTATAQNGNLIGTDSPLDPKLGPLGDNGGPSATHALLNRSPAIDYIPKGANGCGTIITTDQRGISRPQGKGCEIGAYEVGKGKGSPGKKS